MKITVFQFHPIRIYFFVLYIICLSHRGSSRLHKMSQYKVSQYNQQDGNIQ